MKYSPPLWGSRRGPTLKAISYLLLLFPILLPAQGIQFAEATAWSAAQTKARQESKILFVDCYTTWSEPCRKLDTQVFPDSAVGAFFNRHFVNVRLDMEHGEGPALATRYRVQLYPTFLFLDADGTVIHRVVGFHRTAALLAVGQKAADPLLHLAALEKRYTAGERNPALLFAITAAKAVANNPTTGQFANEYLRGQTDLSTPANLDFILRYVDDPYSEGIQYLVAHSPALASIYSKKVISTKLDSVVRAFLQKKPQLPLGERQRLYGTLYPEQAEQLASYCRLDYYRQRGDTRQFAEAAVDHFRRFPTDNPDELTDIASIFAQEVQDPKFLPAALTWAKKAVSLQEKPAGQLTLAQLYWKIGKKKTAAQAARRALALSAGAEAAAARALLDKINGK